MGWVYLLLIFGEFALFSITVETYFWASHQLSLPDGTKEAIHNHNWKVAAEIKSDKLDEMEVVMDFHLLKAMVDNIAIQLNNIPLEKIDHFQQNNSSAENVAKFIYENLEAALPKGVELASIAVTEEPGCIAKFSK